MENELVLSNIFSNLALKDLKNARAVNKKWNSVSLPVFKKKTKINLVIDYPKNHKLQKFRYEMADSVAYENLNLTMDTTNADVSILPSGWKPLPTHFGFVLRFFKKYFKPIVKKLWFIVQIWNRNDMELAYTILQILSPTLESILLGFEIFEYIEDMEGLRCIMESAKLDKLKYMEFSLDDYTFDKGFVDDDQDAYKYLYASPRNVLIFQNILDYICKEAPNIETLEANQTTKYLFDVLKNPNIFGKLKTLKLDGFGQHMLDLITIQETNRTVKYLEIKYYNEGNSCIPMNALQLLLENNKLGLEQLKIDFHPFNNEMITFPKFSSLKSLQLLCAFKVDGYFLFPRNSIQYSVDFPCLKTLVVDWLGNYKDPDKCLKKIYDSFFPSTTQVCKSLRYLKLQKYCVSGRCKHCNMDWELDKTEDLKEMFPFANIVFKENR